MRACGAAGTSSRARGSPSIAGGSLGALLAAVALAGCGGGGGGGGGGSLGGSTGGGGGATITASIAVDGGAASGSGAGGQGGAVEIFATSGLRVGGASIDLPAAPAAVASGALTVPAGQTIAFSALRAQAISAGLEEDPLASPEVVRVTGDLVIAGTVDVDVDQALFDSSEGNVYLAAGSELVATTVSANGPGATASFAVVAERGFVRAAGTLAAAGVNTTTTAQSAGTIFIGARSAYLVGATVDADGADAPAGASGDGTDAGTLVIANPAAVLDTLLLHDGFGNPTSYPIGLTIVSADGGTVLVDDAVALHLTGGSAAMSPGNGGRAGALLIAYAPDLYSATIGVNPSQVPVGDRLTIGLAGTMEANGGAGVGPRGAASGGLGGALFIGASGTLAFGMTVHARGGAADDDAGGPGGEVNVGDFSGLYDLAVTVSGDLPTLSAAGGAAAGLAAIPAARGGLGGQELLRSGTGGLFVRATLIASGGDVGSASTMTAATAGDGGTVAIRTTDCDVTVQGSARVTGGSVVANGLAGAAAGAGGVFRAISANGAVTNLAAIDASGGDISGGGTAGDGGEIDLVVDDNGPPQVQTIPGLTATALVVTATANIGIADDVSGSLANSATLTARGGIVFLATVTVGGDGGKGGTIVLDADPNANELPAGVTGTNTATLDVSGGAGGGNGSGGDGGAIFERAPSGTGRSGASPAFVNGAGAALRTSGGSATGTGASGATAPPLID